MNKEWQRSKGDPELGKPQRDMLYVLIAAEGPVDYAPISHYLVFPNTDELDSDASEDTKRTARLLLRNIKRFLAVFQVDFGPTGFDDDDLDGAMGSCLITHEDYNGEPQARLKLPRIAE